MQDLKNDDEFEAIVVLIKLANKARPNCGGSSMSKQHFVNKVLSRIFCIAQAPSNKTIDYIAILIGESFYKVRNWFLRGQRLIPPIRKDPLDSDNHEKNMKVQIETQEVPLKVIINIVLMEESVLLMKFQ